MDAVAEDSGTLQRQNSPYDDLEVEEPTTLGEAYAAEGSRGVTKAILRSKVCETIFCGVVIANSVVLGLEQSVRLEGREAPIFRVLENIFLSIYVVECAMNLYAFRTRCIYSAWLRFNFVIVLVSVITEWIVYPLLEDGDVRQALVAVRMARMLRLARTARLLVKIQEVRMLAAGLLNSLKALLHTMVLGGIFLFVVGCVAVEMIPLAKLHGGNPPDEQLVAHINEFFGTLPLAMLTLVQFLTSDNPVFVYKPLIDDDGTMALFFVPVIVLGVIFMNLITATMINGGLQSAMENKIQRDAVSLARRRGFLMDLEEAFKLADADKSGMVSREELMAIDADQKNALKQLLGIESLTELFDCLDVDQSGEIGIDEFCHGIEGIFMSQIPLEVKRTERMVQSVSDAINEISAQQAECMARIEAELGSIRKALNVSTPPLTPISPIGVGPTASGNCNRVTADGECSDWGKASPRRSDSVLDVPPMPAWASQLGRSDSVQYERPMPAWAGRLASRRQSDPMPAWASQLVVELKEVCYTNICRGIENGKLSAPPLADDGPSSRKCSQHFRSPSRSKSPRGNEWETLSTTGGWEMLPPTSGACSPGAARGPHATCVQHAAPQCDASKPGSRAHTAYTSHGSSASGRSRSESPPPLTATAPPGQPPLQAEAAGGNADDPLAHSPAAQPRPKLQLVPSREARRQRL